MTSQRRRHNGREVVQKGKGMKRRSSWHRKGDVQVRLWLAAVRRLEQPRREEGTG